MKEIKDKTTEDPDLIAQQIYTQVMEDISDYIANADIPVDEQYSTFMYISSEISSFLMGNAVSPLSPSNQGEVISTLGRNIKKIAGSISGGGLLN